MLLSVPTKILLALVLLVIIGGAVALLLLVSVSRHRGKRTQGPQTDDADDEADL